MVKRRKDSSPQDYKNPDESMGVERCPCPGSNPPISLPGCCGTLPGEGGGQCLGYDCPGYDPYLDSSGYSTEGFGGCCCPPGCFATHPDCCVRPEGPYPLPPQRRGGRVGQNNRTRTQSRRLPSSRVKPLIGNRVQTPQQIEFYWSTQHIGGSSGNKGFDMWIVENTGYGQPGNVPFPGFPYICCEWAGDGVCIGWQAPCNITQTEFQYGVPQFNDWIFGHYSGNSYEMWNMNEGSIGPASISSGGCLVPVECENLKYAGLLIDPPDGWPDWLAECDMMGACYGVQDMYPYSGDPSGNTEFALPYLYGNYYSACNPDGEYGTQYPTVEPGMCVKNDYQHCTHDIDYCPIVNTNMIFPSDIPNPMALNFPGEEGGWISVNGHVISTEHHYPNYALAGYFHTGPIQFTKGVPISPYIPQPR